MADAHVEHPRSAIHVQGQMGSRVVRDLEVFKRGCDVIIANRQSPDLAGVEHKVFTRDLFGGD